MINHPALPPVRLLDAAGPRHEPSDLEQYLLSEAEAPTRATPVDASALVLNPNASPPFDKFEAFAVSDPRFRATWDKKRPDLQDQSLSGYEMSLANIAAKAGWTNQEIMNLFIAFRRRHGEEPKHQDYYVLTISKARATGQAEASFDTLFRRGTQDADDGAINAESILTTAATLLNVPLIRIVKVQPTWERRQRGPAHYRIEMETGSIDLGGIEVLTNQQLFRNRVADYTGILVPQFKKDRWDALIHGLLTISSVEDAGPEGTDQGRVTMWLEGFVEDRPLMDDPLAALEGGTAHASPFMYQSQQYIVAPALRLWLAEARGERVSFQELAPMLRAYGCVHTALHLTASDGTDHVVKAWRLPEQAPSLDEGN